MTSHIPLLPDARHPGTGRRLRRVIASSDAADECPAVLGFALVPVREARRNTAFRATRLFPARPAA